MDQQIRFCTAPDGVRIAYATVGSGPPLVKSANWLSHLEFDWRSPVWRHWLESLSAERRLIRYDGRGCGLSDWDAEDISFDAMVSDLEAVIDALGLDRFALFGMSQGGPIAGTYAVRHPEKVTHLILYGSFALGRAKRGAASREELETQLALTKYGWGKDDPSYRQVFTTQMMPEATREQMRWFNDLQRVTASPENAIRLQTAMAHIDVTDLLPRISVPTLVLHCQDDARVPFEEGRRMAALIPNARFVPLEGQNHLPQPEDPCWEPIIAEVCRFLGSRTDGTAVDAPALSVRPGRLGDAHAGLLTPRELEVTGLIARGRSNREIAEALVIAERTAESHVQHILDKLECSSRGQIAAWAVERGLHKPS